MRIVAGLRDPDLLGAEAGWTLLLVHPIVDQAAEEDFVCGVVGVDGYAHTAGDGESVARDVERLLKSLGDAVEAAGGDEVCGEVAGEIGGDDDELVSAETGEGIWGADDVAEAAGDVLEKLVADVVTEGVVDLLEAVEIDHEERGAGVVVLGLEDRCGQAVFEETAVGKASEMVVEGVPLVAGDALLEHDEEHADDDEELLHVPYLGGDFVELRMAGYPGVEEKNKGPDDESSDDGVLADALARKTELEDNGDGQIEKEEAVVGGVAVEAMRDGKPHGDPGKDLAQD